MRHLALIASFLLIALASTYGQETNTDLLFLVNGDQQSVVVKKVDPTTITYCFVGEELENVINKEEVAKIIFKSGREQRFSNAPEASTSASMAPLREDYQYPTMEEGQGAILPFEFVFDGELNPEEGSQAQEYYYSELMKKPERNTIDYQPLETTQKRLRDAGIGGAEDLRAHDMAEVANILGVGTLITAKIIVKYDRTTTQTSESTTMKVDEKKKKGSTYTSEYNTSADEFTTRVTFKIYDKDGKVLMNESRNPFLGITRDSYITTLSYLMKRTPFYRK